LPALAAASERGDFPPAREEIFQCLKAQFHRRSRYS
jgi:hypothetical protein